MAELTKLLARDDMRAIATLAAEFGVEVFLVGGALRDLLLGKEANDLDFALSGACEEFPRSFADRISGSFFWLDEERRQSRVVKKKGERILVFDFGPLRGGTVAADLALRDFTINALALPLSGDRVGVIDPLAGRDDLCLGLVRACSAAAFDDDPLRLMRAIRFAAELGFAMEENTWRTLCAKSMLLQVVAGERVRDEFFRTLAARGVAVSLQRLCDSGLLAEVAPDPGGGGCAERITYAERAERLCTEAVSLFPGGRLTGYLDREVEAGISVQSLIKLAAVLGSDAKGATAPLAERLRLGKEAARLLDYFCQDEGEAYGMLERKPAERSFYRFFRDREPAGPGMLITARVAGQISEVSFLRLIGYLLQDYDVQDTELFLTGGEIMEILGIPRGELVGQAMARLRQAEAAGEVADREAAREFIKNLLTKEEPIG